MAFTEHYYTRFEAGCFYHVYNRSVDKKPMFKNGGNYRFFLQKYKQYLSQVLDTYSYCLLGNHFHLFVRVRDVLPAITTASMAPLAPVLPTAPVFPADLTTFKKLSNLANPTTNPNPANPATPTNTTIIPAKHPKTVHDIVSHKFRKFFQSYAMAFNKQQNRIGTLFQTPFKRALVDNEQYFTNLIYYIHKNPQLHGIVKDFKEWEWTSYYGILSELPSELKKDAVLKWFGGSKAFINHHNRKEDINKKYILEE